MEANKLDRNLTISFWLRRLPRLTHQDILKGLQKIVCDKDILAIQMAVDECFITFKSLASKVKVLTQGLEIGETSIRLKDHDKTVTNVTLRDLPVELSDQFVSASLRMYGEVVSGSMRRGLIQGTQIETGTRYCKLLKVENPIPIFSTFGDHPVRIFCDNNKPS